MSFKDFDIKKPVRLRSRPGVPEQSHLFDETSVLAIQSALAASRPLLVRGEPGVGKTQLAFAAAVVLERPLVSFVVDARTESSDLKYDFDSVRRLAEAQLCGASGTNADEARELLKLERFITPGALWWGFNWKSAAGHCEENGLVPQSPEPVDEERGRCPFIIGFSAA